MELDDRMKSYEEPYRFRVPPRTPVIIRLDGVAFHTVTQDCEKPYDKELKQYLVWATQGLMEHVPARFAYHQSDEISLLMIDYNKFNSQQWFGGIIQKMASVSASIMAAYMNDDMTDFIGNGAPKYFDARVFSLPKEDIINYFIWRQNDCRRNAISGVAQSLYSQKELNGKSRNEQLEMISAKGKTFENDYPPEFRNGTIIRRSTGTNGDILSSPAPIFTDNRGFLEQFLIVEES